MCVVLTWLQVHHAHLKDGREVAVKVMYPEVSSDTRAGRIEVRQTRTVGSPTQAMTSKDSVFHSIRLVHAHPDCVMHLAASHVPASQ